MYGPMPMHLLFFSHGWNVQPEPMNIRIPCKKMEEWDSVFNCHLELGLRTIAQLLTADYSLAPEDVTYRGDGSNLFVGRVK